MKRFGLRATLWLVCASVGWTAQAADPSAWQEAPSPLPATLRTDGLLPLAVSPNSELRHGIDPDSVSVGSDGVIRYVLVARSASGALNAVYEGLRCATAEAKTYAHWAPGHAERAGQWRASDNAAWRPLAGHFASRPAVALARNGFCDGPTPNGTAAQMLRALREGPSQR